MKSYLMIFMIFMCLIEVGIADDFTGVQFNKTQDNPSITLTDFVFSCIGIGSAEAKGASVGGRSSGFRSFSGRSSVPTAKSPSYSGKSSQYTSIKSSFKSGNILKGVPIGTTKTYGSHSVVYRNGGWYDAITGYLIIDALSDDDRENEEMINNYYAQDSPFGLAPLGLALIGGYGLIKRRKKVNVRQNNSCLSGL